MPPISRSTKTPTRYTASLALAVAAGLSACGGGSSGGSGTLRLALTDAPSCGYESVNVTVQRVRVHQSSSAGDGDAGWSEIELAPAQRFDLLALNNGVLAELGQTALPAGRYTQLRLVLMANTGANPLANSVKPLGGVETPLDTPSAAQSGLKLNVGIDVAANQLADAVLDFDACRSVVRRGGSGRYNLKPVLTVLPRSSTGLRIVGSVAPALAGAGAAVSAQQAGRIVRSTQAAADGRFVLFPVPEGMYDLVVNAPGWAVATLTSVPSSPATVTEVNTDASRIGGATAPVPSSTMGSAAGTVTTGGTPVEAIVQALKEYDGGPTVVVTGGPVDGDSGAFDLALQREAPVRAVYAPSPAAIVFSAASALASGAYRLVATTDGASKTADIDVTSADSTGTTFTFP
jgi:Domain of unknown function (DUF4382)